MLLWLGGVSTLLMFTIPETLASTILANKARRLRNAGLEACKDARARVEIEDRSLLVTLRIAATRPWIMLFDPIAFFAALYLSVVYTLLYMLFTIYPLVFQEKRGWNPGVGELPLLGVIVGAAVGGLIYLYDISLAKKAQIKKGSLPPERRLYIAMFSGLLFPVAMFWFCWRVPYHPIKTGTRFADCYHQDGRVQLCTLDSTNDRWSLSLTGHHLDICRIPQLYHRYLSGLRL